jgi:hypothetical protein
VDIPCACFIEDRSIILVLSLLQSILEDHGVTVYDVDEADEGAGNHSGTPPPHRRNHNQIPKRVARAYILWKLNKPKIGIRVIAGGTQISYCCLTNPLPSIKTDHRRVQRHLRRMFFRIGYVRSCPIVQSTDEIIKHLRYINRLCSHGHFPLDKGKVVSFDFTKLCPLLPSDAVVTNVSTIVALGFHRHRENRARRSDSTPCIFIRQECYPSKERAEWVDEKPTDPEELEGFIFLYVDTIVEHVRFIMDNAYSTFADGLFRQTIGVPTSTNCASEIANIFLFYYELEFFQQKLSASNVLSKPLQCVLLSYMRYIDDIFSATSDASMIFEGSGGFMFGDSAQGTGIFPTAVKKADGSIIEKPLELEGEGGSSVNYELEFFQQKLSA